MLSWHDLRRAATAEGDAALAAAVASLRDGAVLAVKGIGGYHLAVDATSPRAVAELRRRKARDDKPFAVMVADADAAKALCHLSDDALAALTSPRRPIVIAPRRAGGPIAAAVAPGLPELGLLLPYSPLHHLLVGGVGRPLVMTSGNLSDEPIAHDDGDALDRLGPLVDGLLTHDRPIHIRCDDSVVRVGARRPQLLRRSRGYAPEPLALPFVASRPVLAVGAELKSTISIAKGEIVVPSHHIGDLEHLATYRSFLQALDHLPALYGVRPEVVAHDLHPEYLSTKLALDLGLPTVAVQHHHAHVAACMVEHGRTEPVLGMAFDGLGYGTDGTLWGGELLVADLTGFTRAGHLRTLTMPGGVAAIREPWRMAVAWLVQAAGPDAVAAHLPDVDPTARAAVLDLVERGHGPVTSSIGRLFDAAAVLLGGRRRVSYEAQAAIELEAAARTVARPDAPTYDGHGRRLPGRRRGGPGSGPARGPAAPRARARKPGPRGGRRLPRGDRAGRSLARGRSRPRARARHGRPLRRRLPERAAQRDRGGCARGRRAHRARPHRGAAQRRGDQRRSGGDRRLPRCGGAAPRPIPQLTPPSRPSSRTSGGLAR